MKKTTIIILTKHTGGGTIREIEPTLKAHCYKHKEFNYGTLKGRPFPYFYKEHYFEKVEV